MLSCSSPFAPLTRVQAAPSCTIASTGVGRSYTSDPDRYDISTCDMLRRRYALVYDMDSGSLAAVRRPLSPMLYPLIIGLCVVHLCGMASSPTQLSRLGSNLHAACAVTRFTQLTIFYTYRIAYQFLCRN